MGLCNHETFNEGASNGPLAGRHLAPQIQVHSTKGTEVLGGDGRTQSPTAGGSCALCTFSDIGTYIFSPRNIRFQPSELTFSALDTFAWEVQLFQNQKKNLTNKGGGLPKQMGMQQS